MINFGYAVYDKHGKLLEEESGIFHKDGIALAKEVADFILKTLDEFMAEDGVPWNFEYAPGETAGPTLAYKDLKFYKALYSGDYSSFKLYRILQDQRKADLRGW